MPSRAGSWLRPDCRGPRLHRVSGLDGRIAAGEELELFIDSTQREALNIPEPLWRFSLVEAMIRDMSMGDAKFKPGMFVETVQDDANELVINVSLENDRIADIELAAAR
jgi:fumarate reductase flavoprotein subunit